MMTTERDVDAWDSCFNKESGWYPSLERGLHGLTVAQANWRLDGKEMNTIYELVNHILFYKSTLLSGLTGTGDAPTSDTSFNNDLAVNTEDEWKETVAELNNIHSRIREKLATMSEHELQNESEGVPISQWVSDLVRHDIYHTGQIIFIRKLQGSWTA
ncbi:DinB family protein [Paenibacillus hemerocallicola]|uniref:DinB family protein n=1 Tax=Paenibacillus hemerocallicola TaxID=1172614 RepID=A0A5C4T3Z0_9BACL|nr:DinB family protein [Paenibacillus hemerocallicola]TNJ63606.1 DinB family protein [Paenibacillus hemerocallicola]